MWIFLIIYILFFFFFFASSRQVLKSWTMAYRFRIEICYLFEKSCGENLYGCVQHKISEADLNVNFLDRRKPIQNRPINLVRCLFLFFFLHEWCAIPARLLSLSFGFNKSFVHAITTILSEVFIAHCGVYANKKKNSKMRWSYRAIPAVRPELISFLWIVLSLFFSSSMYTSHSFYTEYWILNCGV